jgi:hypothetical protein
MMDDCRRVELAKAINACRQITRRHPAVQDMTEAECCELAEQIGDAVRRAEEEAEETIKAAKLVQKKLADVREGLSPYI